jgi:type VI secretion system protein ImpM
MACGLFGKLPSKRDFVAINAPRRFLTAWENWVQAGLASSREQLGTGWQEAYLSAPIWRFWLGAEIGGAETVGALMPSVDGVGRYFPLTVFAAAPEGMIIDPPTIDSMDEWFGSIEASMLGVLDTTDADGPADLAERLPAPPARARPETPAPPLHPATGLAVWLAPGDSVADIFLDLRQRDHDQLNAGRSFFWTIGGPDYRSQVVACAGLPEAQLFAGLLTGRFDAREDA